ncbi:hypothetical protein [Vallitalea okinawensis]|uniref:hypothetical protein n=1 Tax=Vallitalea okinawensis TaxID=2078660 RepID=UPI0013009568|nr:hypothetical protein [Vallitalea okinawensis]
MNINTQNISSITDMISTTFEKWTKNYSWILSSAAMFVVQLVMSLIIMVPAVIIVISMFAFGADAFMETSMTTPIDNFVPPSIPTSRLMLIIIILAIITVFALVMGVYLRMGYARASLNFVRTGKYQFEDFFMGYKKFWLGFKASFLAGLIVFITAIPAIICMGLSYVHVGFLFLALPLLVIPIIVELRYAQILYLVQDETTSATEIVKKSSEMMKGLKGKYFGLIFLISIVTLLPLFIITLFFAFASPIMGNLVQLITNFIGIFISSFIISIQAYFYQEIINNDQDKINHDIMDANYWLPKDSE